MNLIRAIKLFALVAVLALLPGSARASGEAVYSKGHSTWTAVGFNCSSGTAAGITISTVGYITSFVRITNQDTGTVSVWLGPNVTVSTSNVISDTLSARGRELRADTSDTWYLGYDNVRQIRPKIFCKAADAALTAQVPLVIEIFGY